MPSEKTYLGVVVDNKDPLYEGRARVKVFGVFDDLPTEDLPWAEQVSGLSFGGNGGGGNLSIPKIGSVVGVHFEESNYYKINYQSLKEISSDLLEELREENSYEGTQSILYDSEAQPGTLKMIYTRKKGLVFQLGDATIQLDTQNAGGNSESLRVVLKMKDDEIRMENKNGKQTVIINSGNIELGENAAESVVLGDSFMTLFNSHTHPIPEGQSEPPTEKMQSQLHLSTITKSK
jgi:hypothetical protein